MVLGFLPGATWLVFYLKEDPHPEPRGLIALTFFFGAAFAFFALVVQIVANQQFQYFDIARNSLFAIFVLAGIEELAKFGAAYVAVFRNKNFDEPVDAMIYMVVAALGFATLENLGAVNTHSTSLAAINFIFETATLRFVGATLLHTLTSAVVGYHWAFHMKNFLENFSFLYAIALATVMHTFFNYMIIRFGDPFYSILFVTAAGFFILYDFEKLKNIRPTPSSFR
jgi:RsiW-degrading membrane proteinase PrsW (M82 family)